MLCQTFVQCLVWTISIGIKRINYLSTDCSRCKIVLLRFRRLPIYYIFQYGNHYFLSYLWYNFIDLLCLWTSLSRLLQPSVHVILYHPPCTDTELAIVTEVFCAIWQFPSRPVQRSSQWERRIMESIHVRHIFYFFIFSLDVVFIIIVCYLFIMVNCMIWHISIQHIHTKYFLPCPFPSHYLILLLLFPFSLGINVTGYPEKKRLAWTILNESVYLAFNNNTLVAEVSAESLQLITLNKANTSTTSCIPWAI